MMRMLGIAIAAVAVAAGGWWAWSTYGVTSVSPGSAADADHKEGEAPHAEGDGHDEKAEAGEGHASEVKVIEITPGQRKEAGIIVERC